MSIDDATVFTLTVDANSLEKIIGEMLKKG